MIDVKRKWPTFIGIAVLIIHVSGVVLGLFFFGFTGIFNFLGVEYQSSWSLLLFVVNFFILGFIIDLFADTIANLSVMNIQSDIKTFLIRMLLGFVANWLTLSIVNSFMKSIKFSIETTLIISFILSIIDAQVNHKKSKDNILINLFELSQLTNIYFS